MNNQLARLSYLFDRLGEAVRQMSVEHQVNALLFQTRGSFEAVPADGDQHGCHNLPLGSISCPRQVVAQYNASCEIKTRSENLWNKLFKLEGMREKSAICFDL